VSGESGSSVFDERPATDAFAEELAGFSLVLFVSSITAPFSEVCVRSVLWS
jgi:hypothetical protein